MRFLRRKRFVVYIPYNSSYFTDRETWGARDAPQKRRAMCFTESEAIHMVYALENEDIKAIVLEL